MAKQAPNLTGLLVLGQLESRIKKPFFGGEKYLLEFDLLLLGQACFSGGAVLGAAKPEWANKLVTAWLHDPDGDPEPFWEIAREKNEKRRACFSYLGDVSLTDFYLTYEFRTMKVELPPSLALPLLAKEKDWKVPLDFSNACLNMATVEGLAFGVLEPELTKHMFELGANADPDLLRRAHDAGLDVPREMEHVSFDSHAQELVQMTREAMMELDPEFGRTLH